MKPNPEHAAKVLKQIETSPFPDLVSIQGVSLEKGKAIFKLKLENKHLQPFKVTHGGVLATLIDTATIWSVYFSIQEGDGLTSVDLKLNYLAPSQQGVLTVIGKEIKMGKRLGYAEAEVRTESGELLAHGTSTLMVLPRKSLQTDPPLPTKFIE